MLARVCSTKLLLSLAIVLVGCTLPEEPPLPLEEEDASASDDGAGTGSRSDATGEGTDAAVSTSTSKGRSSGGSAGSDDESDEESGASEGTSGAGAGSKSGAAGGAAPARMTGSADEKGPSGAADGMAGEGGGGNGTAGAASGAGGAGSGPGEGAESGGAASGADGMSGAGEQGMSGAGENGMSGSAGSGGAMMSQMPEEPEEEMPPACEPSPETCDGEDNDCDEQIDEDVPPMPCGNATPPCKQGAKVCSNGQWSRDCPGEVGPSREVCDGKDNDCNGNPDEGCDCVNGESMECGASSSLPCRKGMKRCVNGQWPSTCEGEIAPQPERCDGIDNDCDGSADDGGDGLCGNGQHCAGRDMCVACTRDSHCTGRAPACQQFYCDTGSNTCETREAADGGSCNGTGTCRDGTCCQPRCDADACGGDDGCGGDCDRACGRDEMCENERCVPMPTRKSLHDPCTPSGGESGDCGQGFVCLSVAGAGPRCLAAPPCAANAELALGLFCAVTCWGDEPPPDGIRPNGVIENDSCTQSGTFCWENNFTESTVDGWCVPEP